MQELDDSPTIEKLSKAIDSLESDKDPGNDRIPPEIIKAGKQSGIFNITTLYKNKVDRSDCNNYRGVFLQRPRQKQLQRSITNQAKKS
ncbi:hypothetical protein PoB_005793300 [Plakobranchus ocellatus]|uniref:Uncharacterized protein n=1 Tax=Plakobranchus ocellatus TaxID=259542 RepID=A0AAV4CIM1_9GAST|nr:hypothetical protein PoB_005793300 [Plakobranchus ocellatus]